MGGENGEVEVDMEVLRGGLRLLDVAKGVELEGDQGLRGDCEELLGLVEEGLMEVLMGAGPRRKGAALETDCGTEDQGEEEEGRFEDCEDARSGGEDNWS